MADAPFGFAPQDMMQGTAPVEGAGQYLAPIMEMYRRKLDPQTYISMAKSLLTLPQRSMEAAHEGAIGGPVDVGPAMETAMSMGGARFPFIGRGEAGIFGGRLAATADKAALAKAEDMLAKGATPESIWKDTGWFQGGDGKWRFEIPDDTLSVRKGYGAGLEYGSGEAFGRHQPRIEHPDLTGAYPREFDYLAHDVKIQRGADPGGRFMPRGAGQSEEFYYGDKPVLPTLFVEAPTTKQARSIASHELQHAVQHTEGFASGSNPSMAADLIYERINRQLSQLSRQMDHAAPAEKIKLKQEYDALMDEKLSITHAVRMDLYKRTAGEVEARNVQKRLNMTPEERKATPPWLTEDVPREQQIIRSAPGGSFGSWAP